MRIGPLFRVVILGGLLAATAPLAAQDAAEAKAPEAPAAEKPAEKPKRLVSEEEYELLRLFADTLDQVERNYVKEVNRRELMEGAIRGMLSKLDQYSNYISPEDMDRFRTGVESEFGGVGMQVTVEDGRLTVVTPILDTPAFRAGIEAGDKIVEIEGADAKNMTVDMAVKKMKGVPGSIVKVKMQRGDEEPRSLELKREVIQVATVLGDRRNADGTWNYLLDGDKKLGYIRLTQFGRHTTDELKKAMLDLKSKDVQGLILDMRYNPGGLLPVAIEVCDLFVTSGRIVSTSGRAVKQRAWDAVKEGTYDGFPIAILINHYSASASEIVAACLQDNDRAVVIGERSWGKGSVQNVIEMEGGKSALKLTTAGYLRPNGKNIHKFDGAKDQDEWGVKPNDGYEITLTEDEQTKLLADRRDRDVIRKTAEPPKDRPSDKQFQKALDYLGEKLDKQDKVAEKPAE